MTTASRRLFTASSLFLAAGLVVGCSSDAGDTSARSEATAASSAPATAADKAGVRSVEHDMGTAEVPASPQRVAVIGVGLRDDMMALGVPVVATAAENKGAALFAPSFLSAAQKDLLKDNSFIGEEESLDLDALRQAKPDVIMVDAPVDRDLFDKLKDIAPTVVHRTSQQQWQDSFRYAATVVGKEQQAEQILDQITKRAAEVAKLNNKTYPRVSVVRFAPPETIELYGKDTFAGSVLEMLGMDRTENQQQGVRTLSLDKANEADGGMILVATPSKEDPYYRGWQALSDKVQNSHEWRKTKGLQFEVNEWAWIFSNGPLGAQQILDDMERALKF